MNEDASKNRSESVSAVGTNENVAVEIQVSSGQIVGTSPSKDEPQLKKPAEFIDVASNNDLDSTNICTHNSSNRTSSELMLPLIDEKTDFSLSDKKKQNTIGDNLKCCSHHNTIPDPPSVEGFLLTDNDSRFVKILPELYSAGFRVAQEIKTNRTFTFG